MPRSISEVDNGKLLGFGADLAEVGYGCAGAAESSTQAARSLPHAHAHTLPAAPSSASPTTPLLHCAPPSQDHPGFQDAAYKQRRVDIANLARAHRM